MPIDLAHSEVSKARPFDKLSAGSWAPGFCFFSAFAEADGVPTAVGGPAAVDREAVAVDEGAFVFVGEEGDGAGDVVGGGEAGHGDAAGDVGVGVGPAGLVGG